MKQNYPLLMLDRFVQMVEAGYESEEARNDTYDFFFKIADKEDVTSEFLYAGTLMEKIEKLLKKAC